MLAKFVFFAAVLAAILTVILLTLLSPVPSDQSEANQRGPWLSLSLYVHPPPKSTNVSNQRHSDLHETTTAFIFRHALSEGPSEFSRIVGEIQGVVLPVEHLELSLFNIVHLTLDAGERSGSLSIEARPVGHGRAQELVVVGGTGGFAFARGYAILEPSKGKGRSASDHAEAIHQLKLRLRFPRGSSAVPG